MMIPMLLAATTVTTAPAPAPAPTKTAHHSTATHHPTSISRALACIRFHESSGNYQAVNPEGYGGAYQLSPDYSATWAHRYGADRWAGTPAQRWPRKVQDRVARGLYRASNGAAWFNFGGYSCST